MNRISRHKWFMSLAEITSQRSTCFRRAVGAVIVRSNNPIAFGYNGAPPGVPHCTGRSCPTDNVCTRAVHAEINAIERVINHHTNADQMYVTESPCPACAKAICTYGLIDQVFYLHEYRLKQGLDLLTACGVKVYRMTQAGYIIDYTTGELMATH